ncbi:MAG: hypothetical protein E6Z78_07620 [Veillonella sp.]|nr:hypothetical protein [Veillonella sp.]
METNHGAIASAVPGTGAAASSVSAGAGMAGMGLQCKCWSWYGRYGVTSTVHY